MNVPHKDPDFENLLEYLRINRGFDFTGYKRSTLMRRVTKEMETLNIDTFVNYQDYLEVHPDEFKNLFNTILALGILKPIITKYLHHHNRLSKVKILANISILYA